jgi:putative ABC transport system permease protein
MGMSLVGAMLAGANSLLRAARLPLLALAQPQAWRQAQERWLRYQAALSIIAIGVAAACLGFGKGLASAFVLVAAILLAAALLLPALLDAALVVLTRLARGPLAQWFVADARQQLPALSLALMALLLALAASVGVGSMTESFRRTFTGWLDQRLSADVYLSPRDTTQALAILDWLQARPEVDAALPRWRTEIRLRGWLTEAQGTIAHAGYERRWPLLQQQPQAWDDVAAGRGVMLSEQLARRLELGLGDTLRVPAADGEHGLRVVALYADYGNPKGHILVGADWLRRHFPDVTLANIGVYTRPDAAPRLQQALAQRFGLDDQRLVDQATIKRWSTEVFERTFAATGALNSLTLGVAGVALFISLLTLGHTRLGQLAPLWALGVERKRLACLALGQTLMLSSLTVLLAIPLGLLLAWCLVAVVNVQAFGWRLPMHVFPQQLLQLGLLGVLTSLLAAAGPMWQLARRQPTDLLRRFSDER